MFLYFNDLFASCTGSIIRSTATRRSHVNRHRRAVVNIDIGTQALVNRTGWWRSGENNQTTIRIITLVDPIDAWLYKVFVTELSAVGTVTIESQSSTSRLPNNTRPIARQWRMISHCHCKGEALEIGGSIVGGASNKFGNPSYSLPDWRTQWKQLSDCGFVKIASFLGTKSESMMSRQTRAWWFHFCRLNCG